MLSNENWSFFLADDVRTNPCKCNSHVDDDGFGICRKKDLRFFGAFSCFVDYPSSCLDVLHTPEDSGKYMSAIACEDRNEGKLELNQFKL